MKQTLLLFSFLCLLSQLQAQCPGCVVDVPASFPADTIHLDAAPDGQVGIYYDEDISFRMPMSTDPVSVIDPSIPAGLPIDQIEITSVTNLPPGLSWEANQLVFDTGNGETDGCVKFCGTPLFADSFFLNVNIEATVFGLSSPSTFAVALYIAPAVSQNDGFSMENNIGCGNTTVNFLNNNPSNGQNGFSYSWDFGNGLTSDLETPDPVTYSSPGLYEVIYQAQIDTAESFLTEVTVYNASCGDIIINVEPDLFVQVTNESGMIVFSSILVNNASFPTVFTPPFPVALDSGVYTINVYDDDLLGPESCGSVTFNAGTNTLLTDGDLTVGVTISNPLVTIEAIDTVIVYEQPAPPVIENLSGMTEICTGASVSLASDYTEQVQWYQDTLVLIGATAPELEVTESGLYWVEYTSPDGCVAASDPVAITVFPSPPVPQFSNSLNLLSVDNPNGIPANALISWYQDGVLISDANEPEFCISQSGNYTLEIVDAITGCSSAFSSDEIYDPNVACSDAVEIIPQLQARLAVFPNPNTGAFEVQHPELTSGELLIQLIDLHGRQVDRWSVQHAGGSFTQSLRSTAGSGLYWLLLQGEGYLLRQSLIIQ